MCSVILSFYDCGMMTVLVYDNASWSGIISYPSSIVTLPVRLQYGDHCRDHSDDADIVCREVTIEYEASVASVLSYWWRNPAENDDDVFSLCWWLMAVMLKSGCAPTTSTCVIVPKWRRAKQRGCDCYRDDLYSGIVKSTAAYWWLFCVRDGVMMLFVAVKRWWRDSRR